MLRPRFFDINVGGEFEGNNTVDSGWGVMIRLTVGFVVFLESRVFQRSRKAESKPELTWDWCSLEWSSSGLMTSIE